MKDYQEIIDRIKPLSGEIYFESNENINVVEKTFNNNGYRTKRISSLGYRGIKFNKLEQEAKK